jgi:sulfate/thiosulfate transport system ATP-binding protein
MSIRLEHLIKNYDKSTIIKDLSLEVEKGELFVLLGASGSGKSTLLRMIAGLSKSDAGEIYLHGRNVSKLAIQERGVGFVFQNYSLFRHLTIADNIAFGLDVKHVSRKERDKRVGELLALIGLSDFADRKPAQLSGGQQQRVALARALAPNPQVLLLDEPFGALDVNIRTQLRRNLREIQQRLGVTAILVTHDQEEAFELADRIGIIEKGQLLEVGKPDEVYRKPKHRFTASFLGKVNFLRGAYQSKSVQLETLNLPLEGDYLSNQAVDVMARPESIFLTRSREGQHDYVLGRGKVTAMDFAGEVERLTVMMDNGQELEVVTNLNRVYELNLHLGAEVWAGIRDYHVLPVTN